MEDWEEYAADAEYSYVVAVVVFTCSKSGLFLKLKTSVIVS